MRVSRWSSAVALIALSSMLVQVTGDASGGATGLRTAPDADGRQPTQQGERLRVPLWPCRLIVRPTLLGVVDRGWRQSRTLRQQCEALAAARAVVVLEWDRPASEWHARARIGRQDGVVVARLAIPPVDDAIRLVAHELQHVIEQIEGIDYEAEAKRPQSGVWLAVGGFETQAAIDAGGRVWKEVKEGP